MIATEGTYRDMQANVRASADRDFAAHEVKPRGEGEWSCAAPGTRISSFTVLTRPGVVVLWGDIGDWVLRHSDPDSPGWLKRAARDHFDYLLGKACRREEYFYRGDVVAYVQGLKQEAQDRADAEDEAKCDATLEALTDTDADFDQHGWHCIASDHGLDDAWDVGVRPSPGMLWLAEALRWFVTHVDTQQKEPTP